MNGLRLITDSHTVCFDCTLPGSGDWVWWHLTEPAGLRSWLADGQMEPRLGGNFRLRFQSDDALVSSNSGVVVRGVISCYEPCRRLALSWSDASREADLSGKDDTSWMSCVSLDVAGGMGRTSLSLTHTGLPAQALSKIGAGWHAHLRLLANVLSEDVDVQGAMQPYTAFTQHGSYIESFAPRMRA